MLLEKDFPRLKKRTEKIIKILSKIFPNTKIALNYSNNWELYVAVVLSAQCTDKKVNEVTRELFSAKGGSPPDGRAGASGGGKYKKLEDYILVRPHEFEKDIRSTGFYKNKAKNILAAAKVIKGRFKGKIPKTMAEILTVPGVGRKSANVILGNAYGVVEGIAVDTHVIRLSQKLGLTKEKDPVKIEKDLMQIVPKKDWFKFTYLLIDYGRKYCSARTHSHDKCPLYKV